MAPILDRPHGVALIVHGMWMRGGLIVHGMWMRGASPPRPEGDRPCL